MFYGIKKVSFFYSAFCCSDVESDDDEAMDRSPPTRGHKLGIFLLYKCGL
jgi:hypothetical protein